MSLVFQVVLLFKDSIERGRFAQPGLLQRDLEALHLANLRRGWLVKIEHVSCAFYELRKLYAFA
jgi:hypothetical protein